MKTFEEANKTVHKVSDQWHYPILISHGFEPITQEAVGFVRSYDYVNNSGEKIQCNTGCNSDYWSGLGGGGYWGALEPFLKEFNK